MAKPGGRAVGSGQNSVLRCDVLSHKRVLRNQRRTLAVGRVQACVGELRMPEMTGTVLIAQEGRLQLLDENGAGHLFILSPHAAAETQQLHPLQAEQARVRVTYETPPNVIGRVASRIERLDGGAAR